MNDDRGVATLLFVIMTLSVFLMFMATLQLYNVLINSPKKIVIRHQFDDVGNIIANDVMEIVLTLPHGGVIEYSEIIPVDVAGQSYWVVLNTSQNSVTVSTFGCSQKYVISGLSAEINGTIYNTSSGGKIIIKARRLI